MKNIKTVTVKSIAGVESGTRMTVVEWVNDYEFVPGKLWCVSPKYVKNNKELFTK